MKKPIPSRTVAIKVFSDIGRKWTRHPATVNQGMPEDAARRLIKTFKEIKAEIIPFTPEKPAEVMAWLNIPAAERAA